jgi:hypothetical protein
VREERLASLRVEAAEGIKQEGESQMKQGAIRLLRRSMARLQNMAVVMRIEAWRAAMLREREEHQEQVRDGERQQGAETEENLRQEMQVLRDEMTQLSQESESAREEMQLANAKLRGDVTRLATQLEATRTRADRAEIKLAQSSFGVDENVDQQGNNPMESPLPGERPTKFNSPKLSLKQLRAANATARNGGSFFKGT